ncbi:MAG TPA: bifunctional (p)ppGpp synthetase/guanosine-3',5'-bis(diphosphate) 3'-pyrophosphohydrolase [Chloroflexi bacterium]|nr:bifunctional (p)ppGpp synthetase/guanosine-3',5'-bis(diphosphate) 3'-pyrophosphohydrolase [Chloroflexota bacterium]
MKNIPPERLTNGAQRKLERAYDVSELAHAGQTRKSGESFVQHPLAVAALLAELGMDVDTIAAGLLHDVVEDTQIDIARLEGEFGPQIATLVDGVTKLDKIEEKIEQEHSDRMEQRGKRSRGEREAESLRKMFLAMSEDIRVVVIKLADRLHNMRTLASLSPERRRSFARETMEIFAPLANRLGIWQWKWELEDLSLRYIDPVTYAEIASLIKRRRPDREISIQQHIDILQEKLEEENITGEISGRPKHIYSIYTKMHHKDVPFQQVYDVRGIRVISNTIPDCYRILGIVHGLWRPIPGEFDDYIATPKGNMYQSLHTAVIGQDGKTLEVQIRTWAMHRRAEYGIAAHWRYKEGSQKDSEFESQIARLRSLVEWRRETTDADEFVDAMKTDVFRDRVYTFTPKGKLIDLPIGSTPIDFAYHIHTEVGHQCRGARVNGKLVSLDYQLKNGDQVEILTAKRGGPSRDWLNPALGYVQTSRARSKIRQWFRRQDRKQSIALGREILERELKRLGMGKLSHDTVTQLFDCDSTDDFHAAVGFGDINTQQIAGKISETQTPEEPESYILATPPRPQDIQVRGTGNLLTRLARCCNPLPGDEIIGYVTRGHGVSIHRRDCPNILRKIGTDRLIEVKWGPRVKTIPATISVLAFDRPRLFGEISGIIGTADINIIDVGQSKKKHTTTLYITLEIHNIAELSQVLAKISKLPNVIEAQRHTG